jgi:hypothetical protein
MISKQFAVSGSNPSRLSGIGGGTVSYFINPVQAQGNLTQSGIGFVSVSPSATSSQGALTVPDNNDFNG